MIREQLVQAHPDRDGAFRWRGDGVSRIEGLSDAVFGFALALLVASLGVPRTYADLTKMLVSFPAFTATFWMLYVLWSAQYKFFRRYGLEDARTVKLNIVLLLVVVFYVYPLMFLYNTFIAMWLGVIGYRFHIQPIIAQAEEALRALKPEQWPFVMCVFAAGYIAVFGVFVLLHRHALSLADALDLDPLERLETRYAIREHALNMGIGLLSAVLTLALVKLFRWPPGPAGGMGGMTYALTGPAMSMHFRRLRRARERLQPSAVERPLLTAQVVE
jgi:uncharacterized membrane protein